MADRLSRSIRATVGVYFLLQIAIYSVFAIPARSAIPLAPIGFALRYGPAFVAVSAVFHVFLLIMLLLFKQDFIKEATGEVLDRVNLANRITLLRVSTLPTLLFLVMAARDYQIRFPLLILVVLVFATDFIDGYVSRKAGEVTRVGRMMDSASDYSLLIVLTVVFYYFTLIPAWFFFLVVARLGLQSVLMGILIVVKRRIEPKTTFMGKAAVAGIMVLYAAEVLRLLFGLTNLPIFRWLEWAVGAVVLASMADKVIFFIHEMGLGSRAKPAVPPPEKNR
jgi:phosphatidylglycerophosphate synthase